ncbi:MAG TPA: hypothetical protein VK427_13310 [Kofleriaceae bacterium]|nr:hypothetical protein [Kofleriaceae bacterium]
MFPTLPDEVREASRRPPVILADEDEDTTLSKGIPSKPLLGVLPLARLIPQDIHSVMDYVDALSAGSGALMAKDPRAQFASVFLAASGAGVSLMTDYRLSAAKVIPIEAHEAIDHVWGLTAIALPFVLGYWKTSPRTAITHVVTGLGTIATSLFTDYRSYRGRGKQ